VVRSGLAEWTYRTSSQHNGNNLLPEKDQITKFLHPPPRLLETHKRSESLS